MPDPQPSRRVFFLYRAPCDYGGRRMAATTIRSVQDRFASS